MGRDARKLLGVSILCLVPSLHAGAGDVQSAREPRGSQRGQRGGRAVRDRAQPEPLWPQIKARYFSPLASSALDGARRTRDVATVVAIRSLHSIKQRLSSGWLPEGAGAAARLAGLSARESIYVFFWGTVPTRLLFVPLSVTCSVASASLLGCASALRAVELCSRCAVSISTDLALQASLFAEFAVALAAGRGPRPVPLPELPPPAPAVAPAVREDEGGEDGFDAHFSSPGGGTPAGGQANAALAQADAPPAGDAPPEAASDGVQPAQAPAEAASGVPAAAAAGAAARRGQRRAWWPGLPAQLQLLNPFAMLWGLR